jgi:hypothetical protein
VAKCVYRGVHLNSNRPEDSDTASVEHIIPWALGGSNSFTIADVSKRANNDLGSDVDAPFVDTLPLAIKRHQLALKSQNGNINPIVWRGTTPDGTHGKVTIYADGTNDFTLDTNVKRPEKGQSGFTRISGHREQIEPILAGMLRSMKKRGEQAQAEDGRIFDSVEDILNSSDQMLIDEIVLKVEYFDRDAWIRGMLKIALAAGHKILGESWSSGVEAARIRQVVCNPRDGWPVSPKGFVAGEWDRAFRIALGKTAAVRDTNQHIVAMLPSKQGTGVIAISLFGGDGVPEAVIDIGKLPETMISALNRNENGSVIMGYQVDPRSRITVPITFHAVDKRIAAQGPTNRSSMSVYRDRSLR